VTGRLSEIIAGDVGFVCRTQENISGDQRIDSSLRPLVRPCLARLSHLRMAKDYLKEYEKEIAGYDEAKSTAPDSHPSLRLPTT